jgi:hypothetical protein
MAYPPLIPHFILYLSYIF